MFDSAVYEAEDSAIAPMKVLPKFVCLSAILLAGCKDDGEPSRPAPAPTYTPPELILPVDLAAGWRKGPDSTSRSASYVVEGEGGTVADVSLVILPGQPGILLNHVNGWRANIIAAIVVLLCAVLGGRAVILAF